MNLSKTLNHFTHETGSRIYIVALLNLLTSTLEGIGLLLFLPLLNLSSHSSETGYGLNVVFEYLEKIFQAFNVNSEDEKQIILLVLIVFMLVLKAITYFTALSISTTIKHKLVKQSRERLISKYLSTQLLAFQARGSGYYLSTLTEQINRYMNAFQYFANTLSAGISAFVYLLIALLANLYFGIAAIVTGLTILVLLKKLSRLTAVKSKDLTSETTNFNNSIIHLLNSFQYIKISKMKIPLIRAFMRQNVNLTKIGVDLSLLSNFIKSAKEPVVAIPLVILMIISIHVQKTPLISMMVVMLMFYRAMNYIMAVQMNLQLYSEHYGSLDLIINELQLSNPYVKEKRQISNRKFVSLKLENVSFYFENSKNSGPKNINAYIERGDRVAIIGPSGVGKSTLINLICKQLDPKSGSVIYQLDNNEDIDHNLSDINFGFLGQEPLIFEGSFTFNITLKSNVTQSEINRAKQILKSLDLEEFVDYLKTSEQSNSEASLLRMSVGQKQRLHLARELFRGVDILVLDEPTSALDDASEDRIIDLLRKLNDDITLIIVTHRPKLLSFCNKTIEMRK
ncbi:ABC transporter ATP-binding protein/permease [Amylibacter sp.]|nr:ABC transporter ATP-binding protein/permease [Amylibacter sp.]